MRICLAAALLIFFQAVFLQSSSAQVDATSANYETQTITIALTQEPPQLNGMKATDQVSIMVLSHVMEGLVRYDRRGNIIPGVAERWEIDEKGATFWLRDDALWSDGQPVTAHDFVFAWRNALKPETASEYAFILYPIKNAEAINTENMDGDQLGAVAIDDTTLRVVFERPAAYFIKLTAFTTYFPVREDFWKSRGTTYAADADDLLYNGPFTMTGWTHSASLKMTKNQNYWNKQTIKLNAINADYITADTRARLNLFIDGKIVHTRLDGETYKDALTQRFRIRRFNTGSVFFLEYNHRSERVTRNLNLRRAIQHAFDPDELVNRVLATPGNLRGESLFPVWIKGVDDKFRREYPAPKAPYDVTKAMEHLKKAKAELGMDIPPLVLLVSDSPTSAKQAEYMQGMLRARLGLDIKIDIQTFKQRLAKMTSGDFDIVASGWGPDFDDIMTFGDLFASWNLNNRGRYVNSNYDRLVRVAMNNTDPKTRMNAMGELQQILFDEAVILPQYEQGVIYLLHPRVKGVVRRVVGADPDYTYASVVP
ncbi:MAG: peptide ABC transporter substrate-binding protein [Gammaproteobacteria bacterium]|jgi:oligopeptide transport system substrate-binding protein|nr:peptide ABC transporter substrate-binding protein [Gammaproteobacteria bacterium]MBT4494545.1 peptide ABC transporter substrate-binding protein [Gammaproteobacteria bacterium]MBT7369981.1 peptide ABC transporter substrate-binding protein [Gammaproteobacteria bacterium]